MKQVDDIIKHIDKKKYQSVYFLAGNEPFYIDKISNYIHKNLLSEDEKLFNESILYGNDIDDINILLSEVKQFPVNSNYRLVLVKEAQQIRNLENIEPYVLNPLSSTVFVICYKKAIDKRKKIFKTLQKSNDSVLLETKKIYEYQIPTWIKKYVTEKGYTISDKSTLLLAEFIGNELSNLHNELEKLISLLSKGGEITPKIIEDNIGFSKDFNNFELRDAIGSKNIIKTMKIINYFGDNQKTHPIAFTISTLYVLFCNILIYESLDDKSPSNVVKHIGGSPYFVKDYERYYINYPKKKAVEVISILRDIDAKSKGVGSSSNIKDLLREMAFHILHI